MVRITKPDDKQKLPFGTCVEKFLYRIQKYGYSDMAFYMNDTIKEALLGKKLKDERNQQGVQNVVSRQTYSNFGEDKTLVGNWDYAPESVRNKYTYKNLQKSSDDNRKPTNAEINELDESNFLVFQTHRDLDKIYFELDTKVGSGSEGKDHFKTTQEGKWDLWLLKLFDRSFWLRLGKVRDGLKLSAADLPLSNLSDNEIKLGVNGNFGACLCPFNMTGVSITEFDMQILMLNSPASSAFLGNYDPPIPDRIWMPYQV